MHMGPHRHRNTTTRRHQTPPQTRIKPSAKNQVKRYNAPSACRHGPPTPGGGAARGECKQGTRPAKRYPLTMPSQAANAPKTHAVGHSYSRTERHQHDAGAPASSNRCRIMPAEPHRSATASRSQRHTSMPENRPPTQPQAPTQLSVSPR